MNTNDLIREAPGILSGDPDTLDERLDAWIEGANDALERCYYVRNAAIARRGYFEHQIDMLKLLCEREARTEARMGTIAEELVKARRKAQGLPETMPIVVPLDIGIRPQIKLNNWAVKVDDASKIPPELHHPAKVIPGAPDLKAIGEKLAANVEVPGCHRERGQRFDWGEPRRKNDIPSV